MRRPRRRSRTTRNPSARPALPNITDRPDTVNDRTEVGHWEVDQIIGANNRSSMIWLTERVTRYSIPITMPCGYTADAVLAGLVEACDQIPTHLLHSLSFDQGSSPSSPQQPPLTPPTSSTDNAAAHSTTKAPQPSTLPSPCSDHWNWPTPNQPTEPQPADPMLTGSCPRACSRLIPRVTARTRTRSRRPAPSRRSRRRPRARQAPHSWPLF